MSKIKQEEKLSIIIPVYGTEKYIKKCLDSVVAQTWKNLEVIVVDDATKDDAAEIAEQYAEEYPYIKVLHHKENLGLFRARVTGLKAMTGDYFAFLDSDDAVTIDYYRLMLRKAEQTGADIVAGDFLEVYDTGEMSYPCRVLQQSDFDISGEEAFNNLLAQEGQDFGWHVVWNKIYARHIRDELVDYLQKVDRHLVMCEDVAYSTLFFSRANRFTNVHGEYYLYSRNQDASTSNASLTYQRCKKAISDILYAFEIVEAYFSGHGISKDDIKSKHIVRWKMNMGGYWEQNIKLCKCGGRQKKKLEELLIKLLPLGGERAQNYFDLRSAPVIRLEQQEIKKSIQDTDCEIVSFDVFDTLLVRPFWKPTDLFLFMEPYVTDLVGTIDNVEFHLLREEAEHNARKRVIGCQKNIYGEVTLDEIYEELGILCPHLKPYLAELKQYEIDCEMRFCARRSKGMELVDFAIESGKQIVYTSDMYLSAAFILKMLEKNGFPANVKCFVSCETGFSKSQGMMYRYVTNELKCRPDQIVHVGDNLHSDVEMAKKYGLKAFHLPKAVECMMGQVRDHYYGSSYYNLFCDDYGVELRSAGMKWFVGFRSMIAVTANRVFDNPFTPTVYFSDYSANPSRVGYMAFGPYLFAIAYWLLECCQKEKFDQINFIARDGWVPLKAFELLKNVLSLKLKCNYVYASRKTIAPLLLNNPMGIYSLPENYNLQVLTPQKFVELFEPLILPNMREKAREVIEKCGVKFDMPLCEITLYEKVAEVFINELYNKECAADYYDKVGKYYAPYFEGHCATFDIGYSGRLETVLKKLYGFDITACYMFINKDKALLRKKDSGIGLETFYDFTPTVSGTIREHIISCCGPSCIGFDCTGEIAKPVFESYESNYLVEYVTNELQNGALKFVADFCSIFGEDLSWIPFRKKDACLPMEQYLNYATPTDADLFMSIPFEDDVGEGKLTIRDIWRESMNLAQRHENGRKDDDPRLDYYSMSKPKKWLVWCLVDRKILKDTAKRKLQNHPVALSFFGGIYRGLRKVAHALHIVR